jgi:tetratricopeptide (TPR) repeat protein
VIASSPRHGSASHLRGFLEMQDGDLSRARRDLEDAVALLPELTGAHDMLGTIAYRQGRLRDAAQEFSQEIRFHSQPPGIYFRMGATLQGLGDLRAARTYYRLELARNPEHQSARDSLAAIEGR